MLPGFVKILQQISKQPMFMSIKTAMKSSIRLKIWSKGRGKIYGISILFASNLDFALRFLYIRLSRISQLHQKKIIFSYVQLRFLDPVQSQELSVQVRWQLNICILRKVYMSSCRKPEQGVRRTRWSRGTVAPQMLDARGSKAVWAIFVSIGNVNLGGVNTIMRFLIYECF
jgi:hypothetical protein